MGFHCTGAVSKCEFVHECRHLWCSDVYLNNDYVHKCSAPSDHGVSARGNDLVLPTKRSFEAKEEWLGAYRRLLRSADQLKPLNFYLKRASEQQIDQESVADVG
jgi:hypothetical protein